MIVDYEGKRLTPKRLAKDILGGFLLEGETGDWEQILWLHLKDGGSGMTQKEHDAVIVQRDKIVVRLLKLLG